jgi:hypothetical protein
MPVINPEIHHRRPRGMGGTKRQESGTAANGLFVHPKCHAMAESQRNTALANGWLVSQTAEPEDVPVLRVNERVFLRSDGTFISAIDKMANINSTDAHPPSEGIPGTSAVSEVVDHSLDSTF